MRIVILVGAASVLGACMGGGEADPPSSGVDGGDLGTGGTVVLAGGSGGMLTGGSGGLVATGGALPGGSGGLLAGGSGGTAGMGGILAMGGTGGAFACTDPAAPDIPPQPGSMQVLYKAGPNPADAQNIRGVFKIQKTPLGYVPVRLLTLRYWFTADGATSPVYQCDYAVMGCGNVTSTFGPGYLELGFTGTSNLNPPGDTGEIQMVIHDTNYQQVFNQSDDWSLLATATDFTPNDHVTLYYCGTLVWGTEPTGG